VKSPFSSRSIESFVDVQATGPLNARQRLSALAQRLQLIAANATNVAAAAAAIDREFSVWAIPTGAAMSESMSGSTAPCTPGRFRISANGRLGIRSFDSFSGLASAPERPWSAMAFWDGTAFRGIVVSIWTGNTINSANVVTANAQPVTDAASQFFPTTGDNIYRQVYPIVFSAAGQVVALNNISNTGYQYSSAQNCTSNGYHTLSFFSQDDGAWGIHPGERIDGDTPGAAMSTGAYGFNNYNSSEPVLNYFWGGTAQSSANFVGIVFSA